jgi:hypothetical protein
MAAALCYGSRGGGAALAFHHQVGAYDTETLIGALEQLRRFLGGQKATLVWDGLPAPTAAWPCGPGSTVSGTGWWWSHCPVTHLTSKAVEALWSSLKGMELANLAGDTLNDVIAAAERGIQRIRGTHHLAYSFLRHCGLSLW